MACLYYWPLFLPDPIDILLHRRRQTGFIQMALQEPISDEVQESILRLGVEVASLQTRANALLRIWLIEPEAALETPICSQH